jgi:glycosyltransferase involved in cell wall biosynthesis
MRILHVSDVYRPQVGGIEIFVEGLARRQAAAGHQVTVLTSTQADALAVGEPLTVLRTGLLRPMSRREIGRFDVIHAHLSVLSPLATVVARSAAAAGVPTVMSVHSMWAGRLGVVRGVSALAGWKRSGAVWAAVSAAASADVRRALPHATVRVVPNAVDVAWWRDVRHVPGDELTLLSVMRLAERKRPIPLLKMLYAAQRQVPDVPMRAVIVGSGPLEPSLRRWLHRHHLEDRVTLAGTRSPAEIRDLCARADVYLAPATQESFGIAALEARATGLPVVAMRSGGVREFVKHGVDGLLCHDDSDMVHALTRLALDDSLRSAIRAHNTAVPPSADWSDALSRFEAVYELAGRTNLVPTRPTRYRAEPG